MKRALLVCGLLGLLIVGLALVLGWMAPVAHAATASVRIDGPASPIWKTVKEIDRWPVWRPSVDRAERLGDGRWRLGGRDGSLTYSVVSPEENVLIATILDEGLPYGGRWIWTVTSTGDSTLVSLREEGVVHSALFRFVSKYLIGHERSIREALSDLEKYLASGTGRTEG